MLINLATYAVRRARMSSSFERQLGMADRCRTVLMDMIVRGMSRQCLRRTTSEIINDPVVGQRGRHGPYSREAALILRDSRFA